MEISYEVRWHLSICGFPGDERPGFARYAECRYDSSGEAPQIAVFKKGPVMDFNRDSLEVPIVSRCLAEVIERSAGSDIQRIPASLNAAGGDWEVLNVLACVDCINHERSRITYYPDDDPHHPGKPRGVLELIINPSETAGHHVFRISDWKVAVIVSEQVKTAVEAMGATGVQFTPVC